MHYIVLDIPEKLSLMPYMCPWITKPVYKFVAIANNTLYVSKL